MRVSIGEGITVDAVETVAYLLKRAKARFRKTHKREAERYYIRSIPIGRGHYGHPKP